VHFAFDGGDAMFAVPLSSERQRHRLTVGISMRQKTVYACSLLQEFSFCERTVSLAKSFLIFFCDSGSCLMKLILY